MRVRTCTRCGGTKPLDQFPPIRRSHPKKRQCWCRACFAEANKRNYWKNHEREKARLLLQTQRKREENRRRAVHYLRAHPCVGCGEQDIVVLQFDHLRDKQFNVATMIANGSSWQRIEAEIAKCVVRCANCHRRETAARVLERIVARPKEGGTTVKPFQLHLAAATTLRVCRVCGLSKPLTEFPFRSIANQTSQWICLMCQRTSSRTWYARKIGREVRPMRPRGTAKRSELVARVFRYLADHPCVDCGESDAVVLDFDHLHDKVDAVASMVALRRPWPEVLAEIQTCEVRCANCHTRKTQREIGSYRTKAV